MGLTLWLAFASLQAIYGDMLYNLGRQLDSASTGMAIRVYDRAISLAPYEEHYYLAAADRLVDSGRCGPEL